MKSISEASPVKTRRKFDATFKLEAVRNWLSSGKSAAIVARELGLNESLLFAWRKLLPVASGLQSQRSRPPGAKSVICGRSATF